jgi:formate/nitrite transporter FocA (FNT family)
LGSRPSNQKSAIIGPPKSAGSHFLHLTTMRPIFRRQPAPPPPTQDAQKHLERPSAQDIYEQVANNARQELGRSNISLAISGLAGGIFMGLSALGNAIAIALLTTPGTVPSHTIFFVGKMFYPLGFITVILGRSQLFTENTLYPVALVLAERRHFWQTMRLWSIVLPFNILGALAFASIASLTSALQPEVVRAISQLGLDAIHNPASTIFWSGVMGGWIIATVAWLVSGSHSITGSVMIIWMLAFVVGLGNFAHCIATSGEVLTAILTGQTPWISYPAWLFPAVAGNICGGVGMVTLLEYGQVIYGGDLEAEALPPLPKEEPKLEEAPKS